MFKKKKKEKLEVDMSKLSPEEQKESGFSFKNGLFIFSLILIVAIVTLWIVILNI